MEVEAEPVSTEVRTLGGGGADNKGEIDSLTPDTETSEFKGATVAMERSGEDEVS